MLEEAGIGFLQPGKKAPLVVAVRSPGFHIRIEGRECCARWHHPDGTLLAQPLLTNRVPALVVAAGITLDIILGYMMRPMTRAEGNVEEERTADARTQMVAHVSDRVVNKIGAQMVIFQISKLDRSVVLAELWTPLVRQSAMKAVPAVKTFPERPVVVRSRRAVVRDIGKVPFADRVA